MTRRARIAAVVVIAMIVACWWSTGRRRAPAVEPARPVAARAIDHDFRAALAQIRRARGGSIAPLVYEAGVTITGHVIDISGAPQPVGEVEVVFRGLAGETSTTADAAGAYALRVPPGVYHAFVRGDAVLSFAREDRVRLPGLPLAASAGVPDEALMTLVRADRDTSDVDLAVTGGGVVHGRVVDGAGHPVSGAVVRARGLGGAPRPALGTDLAESDRDGRFELRLAAGSYVVDAAHPRFAGIQRAGARGADLVVAVAGRYDVTYTLVAGCVISGRVIDASGRATSDGAIEREFGPGFRPVGRIEPDGTFQLATTDELQVSLRAWPWKSPPALAQRFACSAGARYEHVVFQLPDQRPDLEGLLVDPAGEPIADGYVDLWSLDPGGLNQQERADAQGRWAAYSMPAGRYRATAHVEGKGVASAILTSPSADNRLVFGGTGRLEGKTTRLANGSFDLVLQLCTAGEGAVWLPPAHRLVSVIAGHYTIDDLPACELAFSTFWRGEQVATRATIPAGGVAHLDLDVGPRPDVPAIDHPEGDYPEGDRPEGDPPQVDRGDEPAAAGSNEISD